MANLPRLAFQCPMKWDEMQGDARERYCAKCNRVVHNLSVLTDAERAALLASAPAGRLCVAYHQRLTARDRLAARPPKRGRLRKWLGLGAAAAYVTALIGVTTQASKVGRTGTDLHGQMADCYYSVRYQIEEWMDDVRVFFGGTPRHTFVMGMVCPPAPPATAPPPAPAPGLPSTPSSTLTPSGESVEGQPQA